MSLIAWYKLNGDANDASGNGRHGTPTSVSWVAGKVGGAAGFNGMTSLIDVANPGSVLDGKPLTVCAWLSRNGTSGTIYPRVIDRVYNGQFACYVNESGNSLGMAVKGIYSSGDYYGLDGTVPSDGTPTHVAWVYNGSQILTYINGTLAGTQTANHGLLYASTSAVRIGDRMDGSNRKWKGWIDDLRVYDEVLPAWQIAAIYNNGRGSGELQPWQRLVRPVIMPPVHRTLIPNP
jgi:hypothetical protein